MYKLFDGEGSFLGPANFAYLQDIKCQYIHPHFPIAMCAFIPDSRFLAYLYATGTWPAENTETFEVNTSALESTSEGRSLSPDMSYQDCPAKSSSHVYQALRIINCQSINLSTSTIQYLVR